MNLPLGGWIVLIIIALAILLFLLDRLALWMERRGWIYYRSFEPGLSARNAIRGIESFVHPEIRYVEEEKTQRAAETDDASPADR
jgi:hypothetical protein